MVGVLTAGVVDLGSCRLMGPDLASLDNLKM